MTRDQAETEGAPADVPNASAASISKLVSRLIVPDAVDALKRIARENDGYRVATRIQSALESIKPRSRRDARHIRSIGYEIVGDLYLKHLRMSVAAMEKEGQAMGPNVFREYCVELLDAYFSGDHMRVGVEGVISLTDSLMFRAVGASEHRRLLFELAEESARTLASCANNFCSAAEKDLRREQRKSRGKDSPRSSKPTSTSSPGQELLDYLESLENIYAFISGEFRSVRTLPPCSIRDIRTEDDPVAFSSHLRYFEDILGIEHRKAYRPYSASVKTHIGFLRESRKKGSGRAFFRGAARDYEKQADIEFDLSLMRLYKARLLEARTLYLKAGMKEDAGRVEALL